jgi:hypothetical protein
MTTLLLAQYHVHYAFLGLHGLLAIVLQLAIALVAIWAVLAIFNIIAAKFGGDATGWIFQIVRVILIAVIAIRAVFRVRVFSLAVNTHYARLALWVQRYSCCSLQFWRSRPSL